MQETDLNPNPLTRKQYLTVSSLLFALFFGAGNLIFPIHLGQMSGANWVVATLGFLCTGVVLPLLSVLAISITRSEGVYDIGRPLGPAFAVTFMVLIHATIGPLFGTPRTASVPFTVGVAPFLPAKYETVGLLVFSAAFFGLAFFISYRESSIMDKVGKVLNPLFLLMLFAIFFVAFLTPMGNAGLQAVTTPYKQNGFLNGFLEGYNTMDALAGLAFGVTVVQAVRQLGKTKPGSNAKVTANAGVLSVAVEGLIYVVLIWLGATSLNDYKLGPDGGGTFAQIMHHYFGSAGQAALAALITLTCLTTAVGLVAAFAQDFHKHFPKFSYHTWLTFICLVSFLTANLGLDQIILWSTPMLMFLYPFSMVLILLSVTSPLFKRDPVVYGMVVLFTVVPAIFDMLAAFPPVVSQSGFALAVAKFQHSVLPFANVGMDWVVPALVGAVIGVVWHLVRVRRGVSALAND
ncbi:branched-chain amino acid transport system II carrier protein [Lactobacillus sp. Sy-1]|uniref:branched-chain amino acid transport system II carrier protein n=1 Tax=Lactobacillus sp. Sy-1 TaxID=2109645 RepID=UPI001C5BBDCF|nr:branched-chain amino acid transport system II carrier protein [Lactobacillus sp. Sy-1]MBW1605910.1 branched-chain amino acid transport system II carrier protein [Lactobacillus sp. Sy-1]